MSVLPKTPLQVALLFDNATHFDAETPDWTTFATTLNTHLQGIASPFQILPGMSGGNLATLGNSHMHITLERMSQPLSMDGFGPVLAQPYYQKMRPELVEAVQEHQRAILIGVGLGSIPFPLDHPLITELGMADDLGGAQDQDTFERRLRITQAAALTAMQSLMPSVVHWGQSDQLILGAHFDTLARLDFPLPLYIHPGFHSSGRKYKGSYMTGVNAFGAAQLVGKHVEFSEDSQPMADSYASCLAYVAYARSLGRHLRDGETFSTGETDDKIAILNLPPTPQHPEGIIRLTRMGNGASVAAGKSRHSHKNVSPTPTPTGSPKRSMPSLFRLGMLIPFAFMAFFALSLSAKLPQLFLPIGGGLETQKIQKPGNGGNILFSPSRSLKPMDPKSTTERSQSLL